MEFSIACSNCGATIKSHWKSCPVCGQAIRAVGGFKENDSRNTD